MGNLEKELNQLKELITGKQDFMDSVKMLAHYQEAFKILNKNSNKLKEAHIGFEAEEGTILGYRKIRGTFGDEDCNIPEKTCYFYFKDEAVIKWIISTLSLILDFKVSILKEELSDIKKEKK